MSLPPLTPDQKVKPRRFELRMSTLFAAIFLPVGIYLPYFPLWLDHVGFGAREIAIILSAPMFLRLATTPFITSFADRASDRVHVLIAMAVAAFLLSLGYFLTPSYVVMVGVSVALAVVWTPHGPLADSLALSGVRRFGSDYASLRIWGSASFLIANLAGGMLLSVTGIENVPFLIAAGLAGVVAASLFAPRLGRPRIPSPLSASSLHIPEGGKSLFNPALLWVVAGAGLITASHGFVYGFGSIYWTSLGIGEKVVGVLWSLGVLAEVGIFLAFRRLFGNASSIHILLLAGVGAMLRWIAFPLIWPSGLGVAGFVVGQSLHALSTGLVLLGVQKMIAQTVADHRLGAAQGLVFFGNGFSMAAVMLVSGPLYETLGVKGFYVMAGIAAAGVIALLIARAQPQSAGAGGETSEPS